MNKEKEKYALVFGKVIYKYIKILVNCKFNIK